MSRNIRLAAPTVAVLGALVAVCAGIAWAQQQAPKYPIMEQVAQKVIAKYQTTSCVDLAAAKQKPPTPQEAEMTQKAIMALRADPQMREAFFNKVAAPIVSKMFDCGMIP